MRIFFYASPLVLITLSRRVPCALIMFIVTKCNETASDGIIKKHFNRVVSLESESKCNIDVDVNERFYQ